ncbi:MAG: GNAT family N-acetyltransferase [Chloroflexota bacterium]|jgi:mycothiol synthase
MDKLLITSPTHTLTLPGAPDVPGLVFRHFRGPDDFAAIAAIGNASRMADGSEWIVTADEVKLEFEHLEHFDPAQDILMAELEGEPAGFAQAEWWQELEGPYRYGIGLNVLPAYRGRGIRRALLRWVEGRLAEMAMDHPPHTEKTYSFFAPDKATGWIAQLTAEGYQPVRYFYKMSRPLSGPLPDFPLPEGLELRPATPDHYRLVWDAANEAFRDHWGYTQHPDEYFDWWLADTTTFQPELWQVAWDIEQNVIAGQIMTFINANENEQFGRKRGYTESISVRRPYRRRGLAHAMICESLRVLQAQGMTEAALAVDSQNLSGATRIYEECGFRTYSRGATYRKTL